MTGPGPIILKITNNIIFLPTDLGGKMAKDLNIPEDLVNKGSFDQWDVVECIKNLRIMTQVYEDE